MLKCELCGESIIKTGDNVFVCEGCGCKYTKEQALKLLGKSNTMSIDNDFVIVAGELKEYKGSSIDVEIPDGVLEVGANVFEGMTSLQSVKLPNSVKHIQSHAFSGCSSLKEVSFGEGIEVIGDSAFSSCESLQNVILPNSLTHLLRSCFEGCTSLKKIDLPPKLKKIGRYAFCGCKELVELTIPDSVEEIGEIDTYSGQPSYFSIFDRYRKKYADLTVRMPRRFDARLVEGCKFLFDLSGAKMDTAEEHEEKIIRERRRKNHQCLACGGEIGFFSGTCKRCGKPFGTV